MSRARLVTLLAAVPLAGAGLAGCGKDVPPPDPAARHLAAALSRGRLTAVPVTGVTRQEAQKDYQAATTGLAPLHPLVHVTRVTTDPDDDHRASAVLSQRWTFGAGAPTWQYETQVALVRDGDTWRVRWTPSVVAPKLAAGQRLTVTHVAPRRGRVLGGGGQVLVTDRPVARVGIDKTKVAAADVESSARALAELVGIDTTSYTTRVANAGPKAFVEAITLRRNDAPSPTALSAIPGAAAIADALPLAPTRDFARPILGTVGEATAELVKASHGRLRAGDVTGLSGLQRRYDDRLRGRPGVVVRAVGGTSSRVLFRSDPVAGKPVTTTLDTRLQRLAERVLAGVRPASALVAVRPSDGHVLAAASGTGSDGVSTATVGRFAPGSTFKVVTSLALLRAGLRPTSTVTCPSTVTVNGRVFSNYSDYPADRTGRISLRTAVANSCNTAMIGQRDRVGQDDLAAAAAGLGLGVDHDLGYPVFLGSVPSSAGATEHAASMIGQGKVEASPVGMASVAASVAKGATVTPLLVTDPAPPDHPAQPRSAVSSEEARELHGLMRAVVTEGSGRLLADVPGPPVAAKTGTAEFGTDQPPRTHTWMVAVHGDLAVAVFVDVGQSGSGTSGPLLERFLRGAR